MNIPSLCFSTDDLPENNRLAWWRELFAQGTAKTDIKSLTDVSFSATILITGLPDCTLVHGTNNSLAEYKRTRAHLADGNTDLIFTTPLRGTGVVAQCGREVQLAPGTAALAAATETGTVSGMTDYINVRLPLQRLKAMVPNVEDKIATLVPQNNLALRLLTAYARTWQQDEADTPHELQRAASLHIHDLVALALGATRDNAQTAIERGARAARLSVIKDDILRLLDKHALSIADIVKLHGISEAYIRKLFAAEGTSFTGYVTRQRLNRAWRMLQDPNLRPRPISMIALDVGFSDLSYFNRMFRKCYGMTPSDAREGRG
jgi:AraC-like DNA-binding protein